MGMKIVVQHPRRVSLGVGLSSSPSGSIGAIPRTTAVTMNSDAMLWPQDAVKVPYVGDISYYYRINGSVLSSFILLIPYDDILYGCVM